MAEAFDPFSINISNSPSDPLKTDAEDNHEVSQIEAALAGVASGVLKIPEGFVSLGAELMDAFDLTENAAAKVEQAFDKINIFEETAEARASGKIIQALVQIGVPGTAGFKLGSKLAKKYFDAKKAGLLVSSGSNLPS